KVTLKAARTSLTLKIRKPSREIYERSLKVRNSPADTKFEHSLERIFADRAIQFYEEWPDQVEVPLQVYRIGDLGISGITFDVSTETGLELKSSSIFKYNFTISFVNVSFGYHATPAQHKLGGYDTWLTVTKVEENVAEKIVNELPRLEKRVK